MPLYDYRCKTHGPFEAFNLMAKSKEPAACGFCGELSARVIKAPNLRILKPAISNAMERNEKSRHSPHVCHSKCSHKTQPKPQTNHEGPPKPKLQSYKGGRPWVIEHA